jgi:hypothetical protein
MVDLHFNHAAGQHPVLAGNARLQEVEAHLYAARHLSVAQALEPGDESFGLVDDHGEL